MKGKLGEREWFENTLPLNVPSDRSIKLEFIGESEIVRLLAAPKNIGIRNFFFGDLEFDQEWFDRRFRDSFEQVKDKYEPELHVIDKYRQSIIDFKLVNPSYILILGDCINELGKKELKVSKALKEFQGQEMIFKTAEAKAILAAGLSLFGEFEIHKSKAYEILNDLGRYFSDYDIEAIEKLNYQSLNNNFIEYLDRINNFTRDTNDLILRQVDDIYSAIKDFFKEHQRFTRNYTHPLDNEIHFIGQPAEGKTHTVSDIAYRKITQGKPAIFLTGNKFNHESDIEQTILKQLNIPPSYSFEDFLTALDLCGTLTKSRVPIIIDGLNETINNKLFSDIWHTHLPSLIRKVKRFDNLILITTCRNSYKEKIWGDSESHSFEYLDGFEGYDVTKEAIQRYFGHFHIKADLNFSNLNTFEKPIFLRLFCEIKNPQWREGKEVEVVLGDDSSSALFEKYFQQINTSVALKSHLIRKNERFIQNSLAKIAEYLWDKKTREIAIEEYYGLIDGPGNYSSETSKADILLNEGLIVTRDIRDSEDFLSFTYELMGGYSIAKYLIENLQKDDFLPDKIFHQIIGKEQNRHPLYENIVGELALLFPRKHAMMLHEIYDANDDRYIRSVSINALWKLQADYINTRDINLIRQIFRNSPKHRKQIIDLCLDTVTSITHPFNAHFLSQELSRLKVWERDLSWSEYVREHDYQLMNYVKEFELQCKTGSFESPLSLAKIHLAAEYVQWILTSTVRNLRDYTTRALYFYGRRFPEDYLDMVIRSLVCDDPYLWERMIAALYGVCMAEHLYIDFQLNTLPKIGRMLFREIFAPDAPHGTTHILARNFAQGCIRIALIHHPDLLDQKQIKLVLPSGPKQVSPLPMVEDEESLTYRPPLKMDFSNYTIGYIVEGGHSYQNPIDKQVVRRQILHRIDELGWSEDRFKVLDASIGGDYLSRGERPAIERYGKKYSWIAYYEVAGHREDLGVLDTHHDFRSLGADLDPSFPNDIDTKKLIDVDLLGDRSLELMEWLKKDDFPEIEPYLEPILDDEKRYVCIDGFIKQRDEAFKRERFTFIRAFLVNEDQYVNFLPLLEKQELSGRWLPEKHENTDAFVGETYIFNEATYSNWTTIEFALSSCKKIVRQGEEGYSPKFQIVKKEDGSIVIAQTYPKTRTITVNETTKFSVLMPIMTYHAPSDNREINKASSSSILAKEIVFDLGLVPQAQSFDLYDKNGEFACRHFSSHQESEQSENLVYLRKDLIGQFLQKNKLKLVWAIWGEREPSLSFHHSSESMDGRPKALKFYAFQKIVEYSD